MIKCIVYWIVPKDNSRHGDYRSCNEFSTAHSSQATLLAWGIFFCLVMLEP
jgi:hypothetical protein